MFKILRHSLGNKGGIRTIFKFSKSGDGGESGKVGTKAAASESCNNIDESADIGEVVLKSAEEEVRAGKDKDTDDNFLNKFATSGITEGGREARAAGDIIEAIEVIPDD